MKKIILIILTLLFCISVYPADIPILFLHGHKKQAQPWEEENEVNAGGWGTWNPQNTDHTREHSSSMTDILDIKYGGYIAGTPLNCDKDSILTSTNGNTKVIYNFSFYRPDGGMGVIGSNGQLKCDYIVTELNYVVKKEHTDAASWEYGYDYSDDPVHNPYPLLGDSWAKNFTRFIDKVLIATGANEVDVVTHSMGALVVRAAMKYYGCKDKIRKILTIAAPNHYFDSWLPESIWGAFSGDPYWMRNGEDWELSADNRSGIFNITFTDKNTGVSQPFTEFLDVYPKGGIATIAGNKGWALIYDNDHVIGVYQVELDNAEFNAVVYQQHSYGSKISKEYCITMSTYTTEYIKSWIIDDVIRDGYTKICEPFVYDINGIEWGNRFYWKDGCLRVRSSAYPHDTSLVTLVRLVKDIFKKDAMDETKSIQTVLAVKAFPIYQYPMAFPGDPVFLVEKGKMPEFGYEYLIEITDMDMTGEKNNRKEVLHFEDGVSSYISLSNISTSCFVGDNINLSWNSNDKFNHQKLLYNINEGVWHTITSLTSDIRNYTFKTTQRGEHKFRIYGFLDVNTPINDISNICNVKSEYSLGFTAEYISVGPYVKLYYFPYGKNVDATPEEDPNYYYDIYKDGIKIVRTNYRSYDYYEYIPKGEQREYFVKYYRKYTNEYMGRSGTRTVFGGDNSGCPYFYIKENGEYIPQNTIMYYGNSNMRDFFLFNYDNKNNQENIKKANNIKVNNFIEAAISENEIETDYIDRIILKAIKYDSDYNLTINKDGQYLFWREREKIDSCINNEGDNIFSLLEYLDGNIYEAYPGDTIYIYRNTDNNQDAISPVISGIGVKPMFIGTQNDASLIIEYWTGKEWSNIVKLKPREYIYSVWNYIPQSTEKIRLIIIEQIDIDVITYPIGEPIKYNEFELKLIDPILNKINVMDKLLNEDNNTVKMENGDTLYFKFHSKSSNKEKKISYLLITDGYYRIEEQEDSNFIKTTINDKTGIEYNGKVLKINNSGNVSKKYEIYNIIGRKIKASILKTNIINTDNIPNGIYFLKLIGEQNDKMYRFEIIR